MIWDRVGWTQYLIVFDPLWILLYWSIWKISDSSWKWQRGFKRSNFECRKELFYTICGKSIEKNSSERFIPWNRKKKLINYNYQFHTDTDMYRIRIGKIGNQLYTNSWITSNLWQLECQSHFRNEVLSPKEPLMQCFFIYGGYFTLFVRRTVGSSMIGKFWMLSYKKIVKY